MLVELVEEVAIDRIPIDIRCFAHQQPAGMVLPHEIAVEGRGR